MHRSAWPVGVVDDSTNDPKVLNNRGKAAAAAKEAEGELKFRNDIRPAI